MGRGGGGFRLFREGCTVGNGLLPRWGRHAGGGMAGCAVPAWVALEAGSPPRSEPMAPSNYTPEEEALIARRLRDGEPPSCPRCGERMAEEDVPPRSDVAYVRRRLLLVCAGCSRSVAVDRRRLR